VGKDIKVTYPTGDIFLTAAADSDTGALIDKLTADVPPVLNKRVTVDPSTFVLKPGEKFTVCFRATIG